ncbi:hypothetical protein RE428_38680 [Marinobacter nanhaiticus D15-8W]|nr:PepSY domain-containing protein [Marinobacter nanhaiticus]BES72850.1 hypothetical protein RE428_38680 [Marinobacter nanhaiticus D15-8W]
MNLKQLTLATVTAALIVPATYAAAPTSKLDDALKAGSEYGFTHYHEIEFDDNQEFEIKGQLKDNWIADVEYADDGRILHEQRERHADNATGLTQSQIREAAKAAQEKGMVRIEEIDLRGNDRLKIEGEDDSGRELEITFQLADMAVLKVDHDD